MNNEESERKMAFILEQQAHTAEVVARLATVTSDVAQTTHDRFSNVNAKINALIDAQIRNEEEMKRRSADVDAKIVELVKSQIRTDKQLRNLGGVVDRYLKSRVGGNDRN